MSSQGITVLGSTGSIGENTLKVLHRHPERFHVVALSAHSNFTRLAQQCKQHQARYAVTSNSSGAKALQAALDDLDCKSEVIAGADALMTVAGMVDTDVVMAAIVGAAVPGPA
jgi:1-deoxy-D-xylulose-5-phosphate reductoisomerase